MPQQSSTPRRERQYEHIKESLERRGRDEDTAQEIAARTVNKERARAGRVAAGQPHLNRGHLGGPAGRAALAPRSGRTHRGAAAQRGA